MWPANSLFYGDDSTPGGDRAALVALGLLVVGALGLALGAGPLSETGILVGYALLFIPYGVIVVLGRRHDLPAWGIVAAAILVRLVFLPAEPLLSDDIFRYVWEGHVTLAGLNPFEYAPASEALRPLRDGAIWPEINHPEVPTIYPPAAQYLFLANAMVGGGVIGLKTIFVLIEAAAVGGCWWWLSGPEPDASAIDVDPTYALALYALNPLVFVEVAWSGHLDVVAWALLVLGLVAWRHGSTLRTAFRASLAVGASIAVKFLGLLALPLLAATNRGELAEHLPFRQRLAALAIAPLVVLASYLPFLGAGADLFAGFGTYAESWRGNDGAYRAVWRLADSTLRETASRSAGADSTSGQVLFHLETLDGLYRKLGWTKQWRGRTLPDTTYSSEQLAAIIAKAAALFVVALVMLWCLLTGTSPAGGLIAVLVALYLFAPIVHPWYVAWLVPLAALTDSKTPLVFSFTCLAAYLAWVSARHGGPWHVPDWAVGIEYGLVVVVACWELVTRDSYGVGRD